MTAKQTSTSRVAKLREEAKRKGYVRREYYATPDEHHALKQRLLRLRK